MKQEDTNNQSVIIEDLTAQNTEGIKGGPKRIFIGGLSAKKAETTLLDLEPKGDVTGGMLLPAVQKVREAASNHNETLAEDNREDESITEKLFDLTVDEEAEAEIKGGMQYRAKRAEMPTN